MDRKASAPPVLNRPKQGPFKDYEERVKMLSDKTEQLINAHKNAKTQQFGNGQRSVSLGSGPPHTNGFFKQDSRPKVEIREIPPSPLLKRATADFNEPLTVTCDTGK